MKIIPWEEVPIENISRTVTRQVIWGNNGTIARFRFVKGTHVSLHRHAAEQFTCLLDGAMRLRAGGEELTMRAGDVLVVPASVEHEVWVLEDSVVLDFFAPARDDWPGSEAAYLNGE